MLARFVSSARAVFLTRVDNEARGFAAAADAPPSRRRALTVSRSYADLGAESVNPGRFIGKHKVINDLAAVAAAVHS